MSVEAEKAVMVSSMCMMLLLAVVFVVGLQTVPPDVNGELKDGWETVPVANVTICLVKSKPPEELLGILDCRDEDERKLCLDTTTTVHDDKLDRQKLMDRYPGSYLGPCEGDEE